MKKTAVLLVLLLPGVALGEVPSAEDLKKSFEPGEQLIIAGLLKDPAQNQEFASDSAKPATPELLTKWRARMAAFAQDYLSRPHAINMKAETLPDMMERSEWGCLMALWRQDKDSSSLLERAQGYAISAAIDDAVEALKNQDPSPGVFLINTARPKFAEALQKYLSSPEAQKALAENSRPSPPPEPAPKSALEQARRIEKHLEKAKKAPADEESVSQPASGFDNQKGPGEAVTVPAAGAEVSAPLKAGLSLPTAGAEKKTDAVPPPSQPEDELAELHAARQNAPHYKLYGTLGGAAVGGGLGYLLGGLLGAALIGSGVGAAVGAYAGYKLAKKVFG